MLLVRKIPASPRYAFPGRVRTGLLTLKSGNPDWPFDPSTKIWPPPWSGKCRFEEVIIDEQRALNPSPNQLIFLRNGIGSQRTPGNAMAPAWT